MDGGKLEAEPEPLRPLVTKGFNGERGVESFSGRLAPEYEGDTRERYSNPYAARLAEVSKQRPEFKPGTPTVPIRRDGYFSVKPANLLCDSNGRNCKFAGPTGTPTGAPGTGLETGDVPDGKFLREDLELLRGNF